MYNKSNTKVNNWYSQKDNITKSFIANMNGTLMDDYVKVKYELREGKVLAKLYFHNMPCAKCELKPNESMQFIQDGEYYKIVLYLDTIKIVDSINSHLNAICEITRLFNTCVNLVFEVSSPLLLLALRNGNNQKDYYKDILKDRLGEIALIYNKKE